MLDYDIAVPHRRHVVQLSFFLEITCFFYRTTTFFQPFHGRFPMIDLHITSVGLPIGVVFKLCIGEHYLEDRDLKNKGSGDKEKGGVSIRVNGELFRKCSGLKFPKWPFDVMNAPCIGSPIHEFHKVYIFLCILGFNGKKVSGKFRFICALWAFIITNAFGKRFGI